MVGKGRLSDIILKTAAACLSYCSCTEISESTQVHISFINTAIESKASLPDENRITDVSLMIFDRNGNLEYSTYSSNRTFTVNLLVGEAYTFCTCLNFGYRVSAGHIDELHDKYFYLAYPDEYREGIPMFAKETVRITENGRIILEPLRLMSKISIRMDRSRLSENVKMEVRRVRIGNCPKKVSLTGCNKVESEDDCFPAGFSHSGYDCARLNTETTGRMSEDISLFMLENMQGTFTDMDIRTDQDKVFKENDIRSRTCSYIEIETDYTSSDWISTDGPLTYRFYLGESPNNFDIERNCHYKITICPEDTGLHGDGWRVDKSGLQYTGKASIVQYPSGYITGNIGEKIHIGCILTPSDTPFDIGLEYLDADRNAGLYDYEIDADGRGATLTLKGSGRGLVYMEAGPPVNDAALFIIEINLPDT